LSGVRVRVAMMPPAALAWMVFHASSVVTCAAVRNTLTGGAAGLGVPDHDRRDLPRRAAATVISTARVARAAASRGEDTRRRISRSRRRRTADERRARGAALHDTRARRRPDRPFSGQHHVRPAPAHEALDQQRAVDPSVRR
jgi:hypothetical protein